MELPVYRANVGEMDNTGIFAVSFVDIPAIEVDFIRLAYQKRPVKLMQDRKRHVLTGPVLIPDQLIYRNDEAHGEYYMQFTRADILKISEKMARTGIALQSTTHQHEKPLKGNYLTEMWIVNDPANDKATALGFNVPAGTLMCSYKVGNAQYWAEQVETGKVRGFSLEGFFNFNKIKMAKQTQQQPSGKSGISAFFKGLAAMLEGDTAAAVDGLQAPAAADSVDAGTPFIIFELEDGSEIYVDSEGYATLDGEQAPAGDHVLADGNVITIDDAGYMVATAPADGGTDPATPPDPTAMAKLEEAARERGKAYLAKMAKKNPKMVDAARLSQIKKLKAQIAELEKTPATAPQKPVVEQPTKLFKDMTRTEKMAAVLRARQQKQTS